MSSRETLALAFRQVDGRLLEQVRESQAAPPEYVPTPWPTLNSACRGEGGGHGIGLGWYWIVAGLTGAGKTLVSLNLVDTAMRRGVNVLYVSLEMSAPQLVTRLRAIAAGEDIVSLEWGSRFNGDLAADADRTILDRPGKLFLNTEPIYELADIREVVSVHAQQFGVRLVVVDYAQLVTPAGRDSDLFAKMAEVSAQLRFEAQRSRVVCLALSQLNRRDRSEISLDALFGSSRFGFDADLVLGLSYSRDRNAITRTAATELKVLKNRHGPAPDIPVEFDYRTFRVREIERAGFGA